MFGRELFFLVLGTTTTSTSTYADNGSSGSKESVRITIPNFTVFLSPTTRDFTDDEKELLVGMVDGIFEASIPSKVGDGYTLEFMQIASAGGGRRRLRTAMFSILHPTRQLDSQKTQLQTIVDETGVTEVRFPGVIASFRSTDDIPDVQLTAFDVNAWAKECLEKELPGEITAQLEDFPFVDSAVYKSSVSFSKGVVTNAADHPFGSFFFPPDPPESTVTVQEAQDLPEGDTSFLSSIGNNTPLTIGAAIGGIAALGVVAFMFVFLVRRRKTSRVGAAENKELYDLDADIVEEVIGTNQELGQSQDQSENEDDSTVDSRTFMNRYMSFMHVIRSESFEKGRPGHMKKDMMQAPWSSGKSGDGMVATTTDDVYPSQILISDSVLQPSYFLSNEEGTYSYSGSSGEWAGKSSYGKDVAWDPDDAGTTRSEEMKPPFVLNPAMEKDRAKPDLIPPSQVRKSRFFL